MVGVRRLMFPDDGTDGAGGSETPEATARLVDAILSRDAACFVASGAPPAPRKAADAKGKYAARFNGMLGEFSSWEAGAKSKTKPVAGGPAPRLEQVLEGCFAGAKLPALVAALRIVYVEFAPLRLSGDLIFKLMRKVTR